MRISRLDLPRYGKFTDKSVALPRAPRDFHLIVGPNEAGKSTLRSAIQDLLFGIETRSRYNFLHPHSEMRLGALIEHGDDTLDFIRSKARSKTLQTAGGKLLADNALLPFLGQVDRAFFDQMFGLNHERLVTGGQQILSAGNDVGQILFQAAAGIGSLGEVRDRLEAEADKLWARRKSSDREYYIASAELEQAEAALKQATVRTKDWQEARARVDALGEELGQARQRYQALEQQRMLLERVRRVAPMLATLADLERQLADLGEVVALPENAAEQLANAEHEIAVATQSLTLFEEQGKALQAQIEVIHPDAAILARGADIEALAEMRQQVRNLEGDIGKRAQEINVLWEEVEESARQLGWPAADEAAVRARMPGSLVRSAIGNLVRRHEALAQALTTAEEMLGKREQEAKLIDAEIAQQPATDIPVTLIDALATARSLGDVASQQKRHEALVSRLQRELETAVPQLGNWNPGPDGLRKLLPPSHDEMSTLIRQRGDLESTVASIGERLAEVRAEGQALLLEISQYRAAHHPVTLAEVEQVRAARDSAWQSIRRGAVPLPEAAPGYEQAVVGADALSDRRHDKAREEAELQSRLDQQQRLQQQLTDLELRLHENTQRLAGFDQDWAVRGQTLGLVGMPLHQANDWRTARERVLGAADALAEARSAQNDFARDVAQARSALTAALPATKPEAGSLGLSALILQADELVKTATRAQERGSTLATQKLRGEAAMPELHNRVAQARAALATWQADLQKNLALAHLPTDANIGAIEDALGLFERMNQHLQKIRDLRVNRIDMMRQDLDAFVATAQSLAMALAPELAQEPAAQIALELDGRLRRALSASRELDRLKGEFENAATQGSAASGRIAAARAGLEPLLRLSGTADNEELRAAIGGSDRLRSLTSDIVQAARQLLQAGDGLERAALEAEFAANDAAAIAARLSETRLQFDAVVDQQNRLSGALNAAEAELGKIAGQDEAARAESRRQEALARMANAVERFIKVHTAAKLLRWAIERFRESKQGPMLARASAIFGGLTGGAFGRLVVDYESEPLRLSGQRDSGGLVDIEGLSDGTRDQLYLALRLAALELHLEQTVPLPFIADDLFINYDDGRARAGLAALAELSERTQVIFLTHHEHLVPVAQAVLGVSLNVVTLSA